MFQIQPAEQSRPVNVPVGPLVTPANPAVTPEATQALINSMREGFITSQDIADRLGELGARKRKAEIQQAKEIVDPAAIEARKKAIAAGAARADLEVAQAGAAMPLIQPKADLEVQKIAREKAGVENSEKALTAWADTGNAPVRFVDAEGKPTNEIDYEQTAHLGSHVLEAKSHMTEAASMLKGELKEVWDANLKQKVSRYVNALDQDVSPGSPARLFWEKEFQSAYKNYYNRPKPKPRTKGAPAAKEEAETKNAAQAAAESEANVSLVTKKSLGGAANTLFNKAPVIPAPTGSEYAAAAAGLTFPGVATARTWLTGPASGALRRSDAEVAKMTDQEVADAWRSAQVATPNTVGRVVVTPLGSAIPVEKPSIEPQWPGAIPAGQREVPKVLDALKSRPQYSDWTEKLGSMQNFAIAAKRIQEGPQTAAEQGPAGLQNMRQKDFALIQSIRQLAVQTQGGGASGRGTPDLQSKNIEEQLPLFEKLADWKQTVLGTGILSPGTRERLVKLGNDYIRAKEANVLPTLKWAVDFSEYSPDELWGAESIEKKLLNGGSLIVPETPIGHGGAAAQTGTLSLPSGRKIVYPGAH